MNTISKTNSGKPLVSICCITYNHRSYIEETLDGFLMQETDYPLEIIIHDDASTDGTADVLRAYEREHPGLFRLICQTENQWSQGKKPTLHFVFPEAKGKYIAYCEGDDYWTDPHKVQKQVDFLEANPSFSLCFHDAWIKHEGIPSTDRLFCPPDLKEELSLTDIIARYTIPTSSMTFRKESFLTPSWFHYVYNLDYGFQLMLASQGAVKYIPECMSVYRKNANGLSGTAINSNVYIKVIELLTYFDLETSFRHHKKIEKRKKELKSLISSSVLAERSTMEKMADLGFLSQKVARIFR